ncbi:MAG: glycine cleavage system protein H, partial [Alphaproteobacteria bacterium]|nr:glycine cleavage system protein H [Alphaproteobacteria bacterium]
NSDLEAAPNTVNDDPHGKGWFFKMKLSNSGELDSLMDEAGYKAFVEGLA